MSSPIPDVPSILYCGIPDGNGDTKATLLQSGSLQAGLTRLVDASGTLRTVNHEDHVAHREVYVIQLECMWANGKGRAILDPKQGTTSLRSDGYDVAIQNKLRGGYRFVILNPFKTVYRISFLSPKSSSPVIVASSSDTDTSLYRRRAKNDPREPQDEVDALLLKLNPSRNPIDEFSVEKVAFSYRRDQVWAKNQLVAILRRVWRDNLSGQEYCWKFVPLKEESVRDISLKVLYWSFGRKAPRAESGLRATHLASQLNQDDNTTICLRPSHLHLTGAVDPTTLKQTADSLSSLLEQMRLGNGV